MVGLVFLVIQASPVIVDGLVFLVIQASLVSLVLVVTVVGLVFLDSAASPAIAVGLVFRAIQGSLVSLAFQAIQGSLVSLVLVVIAASPAIQEFPAGLVFLDLVVFPVKMAILAERLLTTRMIQR